MDRRIGFIRNTGTGHPSVSKKLVFEFPIPGLIFRSSFPPWETLRIPPHPVIFPPVFRRKSCSTVLPACPERFPTPGVFSPALGKSAPDPQRPEQAAPGQRHQPVRRPAAVRAIGGATTLLSSSVSGSGLTGFCSSIFPVLSGTARFRYRNTRSPASTAPLRISAGMRARPIRSSVTIRLATLHFLPGPEIGR